jgi:ankyrin repeat protein
MIDGSERQELSDRSQDLFTAIQNSDIERVQQLVVEGVALDQVDEHGTTPLTLASSIGNAEIIELLIAAGAPVNVAPKPLVFNPRISSSAIPSGHPLGELIAQATQEMPEEAKAFYADFLGLFGALSQASNSLAGDATQLETQPLAEDDFEEDEYEDEDEDGDETAETPLGSAVLNGDVITVRALLAAGANPNPSVWHEGPVLVEAARKGNVEIVQALIEAGANVNRGFDELPLHTAAEEGHLAVVRLLLDSGAEVEGYEEDRWTALMGASFAGHLSIVQLLVEHGADVNAWSQGETPLMLAARKVHRAVYDFLYPLVSEEIRAIGDRDAEQEMANTIRRETRGQNKGAEKLIDAAMYGKLAKVQTLIASGADVNAIGSCGRTALSLAIQGGHIPVIQALLDAGADPNLSDETDDGLAANSPLMEAASTFFATNRAEMVRLLLKWGANINQQDATGNTALMCAIDCSDMDVFEALVTAAGVDLDIKDNEGNTALMRVAHRRELSKAVHRLKEAGASEAGLKEVELVRAAAQGNLERVNLLLQDNLNVNLRIDETTALCIAASDGHHEMVQRLIEAGADVDKRSSEGYFNPLLSAAYAGHLEVVRVLLEAGADVHVRVKDFLNPLEYADLGKREGHKKEQPFDEVIALLEQYGATRSA